MKAEQPGKICDYCGNTKHWCARIYLKHRADRRTPRGYYDFDSIKLCQQCLNRAAQGLAGARQHEQDQMATLPLDPG